MPICAIAAFGLPGSRLDGPLELNEQRWAALVAGVKRERIEGLLVGAVDSGVLDLPDVRVAEVREIGKARASADLELERHTLRAVKCLETAGVDYRVLKGPTLAHTAYPDPLWRGFGDIDLLVEANKWYTAESALEALGATRVLPEIRPGFDVRFGKDATLTTPAGWEIDLHRRLVVGPYGFWAVSDELFEKPPATLSLGGEQISILEPEDAFLYACYSAALADDPPRLAALRDVAQIAFTAALEVERLVDTACRWNGSDVVVHALDLSESQLGVPLSETAVARRLRSIERRGRHRVLMASYRGPGRGYTSQLAGVVALSGMRVKAAYLGALVRPQDSYLAARGFTASGFIAHAGRRIWSHK